MFYTVWGALSSTSVWIKSFNPSVLSPTVHWNQLSSDFLSLANGFKQHVGGGERLRWSFWENLFSPISYIGTMWKKNQPATLTSIFKTLALFIVIIHHCHSGDRIFGYTTLSTLVSKRKVYQTRYTSAKMCSGKFPSFVLKGNLWISRRLICLLSDDSSWSFLSNFISSCDLPCVRIWVFVCVQAWACTITTLSCDPVCNLLTASLLFCLFHVAMYLFHMHMHERKRAHTQMQFFATPLHKRWHIPLWVLWLPIGNSDTLSEVSVQSHFCL